MQTSSTCPDCGGEGQIIMNKCPDCTGDGIVKGEEVITMKIPAGVEDGMQLSMSGKGNSGARSGVPGDLIIVVEEIAHKHFERDGKTLIHNVFVSISEAALGSSLEIPTLDGKARIKIPAGTQAEKCCD